MRADLPPPQDPVVGTSFFPPDVCDAQPVMGGSWLFQPRTAHRARAGRRPRLQGLPFPLSALCLGLQHTQHTAVLAGLRSSAHRGRMAGISARLLAATVVCAWLPLVAGLAKLGDKDALVALYEATSGASWSLSVDAPDDEMLKPGGNDGWDLTSDPCPTGWNESWHGVACVDPCYTPIDGADCRFGRITGLNLQFNGLQGTIPDVVFDKLINLTTVDLSHNSLSGTIPTTVGKLRNAQMLQLSHNLLSGTIPTEIRTMGSHVPPDEMATPLEDLITAENQEQRKQAMPPMTSSSSRRWASRSSTSRTTCSTARCRRPSASSSTCRRSTCRTTRSLALTAAASLQTPTTRPSTATTPPSPPRSACSRSFRS